MRRKRRDDCLRQCVARVTGREPWSVPHFVRKYKGRWAWGLQQWCTRTGHNFVMARSTKGFPMRGNVPVDGVIHIGMGTLPSSDPVRKGKPDHHAVIYHADGRHGYNGGNPLRYVTHVILIWPRGKDRQHERRTTRK